MSFDRSAHRKNMVVLKIEQINNVFDAIECLDFGSISLIPAATVCKDNIFECEITDENLTDDELVDLIMQLPLRSFLYGVDEGEDVAEYEVKGEEIFNYISPKITIKTDNKECVWEHRPDLLKAFDYIAEFSEREYETHSEYKVFDAETYPNVDLAYTSYEIRDVANDIGVGDLPEALLEGEVEVQVTVCLGKRNALRTKIKGYVEYFDENLYDSIEELNELVLSTCCFDSLTNVDDDVWKGYFEEALAKYEAKLFTAHDKKGGC